MLNTDGINTISLTELNSEAGLLTRIDREYLVPPGDTQHIINHLTLRAQVLRINDLRHFRYALTYFDTPSLGTYFLTARKRRRHYKIHTRTYLDSDLCFLEVKTSGSHETAVEDRFKYDPDDADRVTPDGRLFVIEHLVGSGICSSDEARTIADTLVPAMDSTYSRATLRLPHNKARATFDTQLIWDLFGPDGKHLGQGVMVDYPSVVGTKDLSAASPTSRLLWYQGRRPAHISKYATGMALLYANPPTDRWSRTAKQGLGCYWRQARSHQPAA